MKIGVLGTGIVGTTLGTRLVSAGHSVMMGSRDPDNPKAAQWVSSARGDARQGTFADAARFGEVILNCTAGTASLHALELAGAQNLAGKVLIDVSNPLDFSKGMPPTLTVCNSDSLGEQIQRAFPHTRVVKTLNTVNCRVMADPGLVPGEHNLFLSGDDPAAKAQVAEYLGAWFGWKRDDLIDLGDITTARGAEMMLPIWVRLWGVLGTADFNWRVVVGNR